MRYNFGVNGDEINLYSRKRSVSGNVNTYECIFSFGEEWEGFAKFATFEKGQVCITVPLPENECKVPEEMTTSSGNWSVGVFATNGSEDDFKRYSTNVIEMEAEEGAYKEGNAPSEPSPEVWEIYASRMDDAVARCESAAETSEGAKADSLSSAQKALESERQAENYKMLSEEAKESALNFSREAKQFSENAGEILETVTEKASAVEINVQKALESARQSALSEENAKEYSEGAKQSEITAEEYKEECEALKSSAEEFAGRAESAREVCETVKKEVEIIAGKVDKAREAAEAAVGKTSYIGENGNWWEWRDGEFVDSKVAATGPAPQKGVDYFDGYTPQKGIDYFDGYTPQKGTDYFTPAEKEEMVQEVLANFINVSEVGQ